MRKHHVGDVIVVRRDGQKRIPLGIVTDRDIVIETVAPQVDMALITAGDIMTAPLVTVHYDESFTESLRLMREHKVRRLPVVANDGALYGIVTADDIIHLLSHELSIVTHTMAEQPMAEGHIRR
jgi:CBS domain-containing protein